MNGKRDEKIRSKAYGIWEREGRPEGRQEHHWHQAVREVDDESSDDQAPAPPETPTGPGAPASETAAPAKRTRAPKAPAKPKAKPKA